MRRTSIISDGIVWIVFLKNEEMSLCIGLSLINHCSCRCRAVFVRDVIVVSVVMMGVFIVGCLYVLCVYVVER